LPVVPAHRALRARPGGVRHREQGSGGVLRCARSGRQAGWAGGGADVRGRRGAILALLAWPAPHQRVLRSQLP